MKTCEELTTEDEAWREKLQHLVAGLKGRRFTKAEIGDAIHFFGGPPSECYRNTCNCPMH